jgi:hypothetical protein
MNFPTLFIPPAILVAVFTVLRHFGPLHSECAAFDVDLMTESTLALPWVNLWNCLTACRTLLFFDRPCIFFTTPSALCRCFLVTFRFFFFRAIVKCEHALLCNIYESATVFFVSFYAPSESPWLTSFPRCNLFFLAVACTTHTFQFVTLDFCSCHKRAIALNLSLGASD